jgi:glycosyltransferase involved in cell wall biosynthesis
MNVFIIPSWYPSKDQPHTGIFFKEQAEALADVYPDSNFAISTWGSHETDLLIEIKDHINNIPKLLKFPTKNASKQQLKPNLREYYSPALTWTRKILQGNIKTITRVNEEHFLSFRKKVGQVDIIHAHSAHPAGWVAMELAQRYNLPYIITEHMGPFPFKVFLSRNGKLSIFLEKPLHSSYSNVAVSPQLKDTLNNWGIPRVTYIPNLTDESFFKLKLPPSKQDTTFTFFTLARLVEGKGISFLLEAFELIAQKYANCQLKIGGNGPEREVYRTLASGLGVADKVVWLGTLSRQQALDEFQNCDAFILPSLHENLPLVLIEALACGKPLIGTYCGGSESIINEKNGLVVEPGNVDALYKAMEAMYISYDRYSAEEIRADFMSRYSRPVVCKQIMELYQQVITQHNSTS